MEKIYIKDLNYDHKIEEGDIVEFVMPNFCSGDYIAKIYFDEHKEPYIDKTFFYSGYRDLIIRHGEEETNFEHVSTANNDILTLSKEQIIIKFENEIQEYRRKYFIALDDIRILKDQLNRREKNN